MYCGVQAVWPFVNHRLMLLPVERSRVIETLLKDGLHRPVDYNDFGHVISRRTIIG